MSLPDISKMVPVPPARWRALGTRLRTIGVTLARAQEVTQIGVFMLDAARAPIRKWHLRRMHDSAACAMRMLMFDDAVSRAEAESALGELPLDPLVEAGFILRLDDGKYVSPFNLNLVNDIFVICDHLGSGSDAVMGAGQTTTFMCDASKPSRRLRRGLDLGCGAGTGALSLASKVAKVIGTDINPRAIALSKINAALNGIDNAEFREGDLFAPVAGENFDIIISQPPFVSAPPGLAAASYEYGGPRGDELPLRLLREITPYLARNGRAVILAEWPELEGETVEQHLRAALPSPDLKLLILQCPGSSLNDYCAIYAASDHPNLGPEFERDTLARREHLESMGIRGLRVAINILQHAPDRPTGWTSAVDIQGAGQIILSSERIDKMIAARDLATRGEQAMLAARLRVPEGTSFIEERSGLDAAATSKLMARLSPWLLVRPADLNGDALRLLALVHQSASVKDAGRALQASGRTRKNNLDRAVLPALRLARNRLTRATSIEQLQQRVHRFHRGDRNLEPPRRAHDSAAKRVIFKASAPIVVLARRGLQRAQILARMFQQRLDPVRPEPRAIGLRDRQGLVHQAANQRRAVGIFQHLAYGSPGQRRHRVEGRIPQQLRPAEAEDIGDQLAENSGAPKSLGDFLRARGFPAVEFPILDDAGGDMLHLSRRDQLDAGPRATGHDRAAPEIFREPRLAFHPVLQRQDGAARGEASGQ